MIGDSKDGLKHLTISQVLSSSMDLFANRTAISFYKRHSFTYKEVLEKVSKLLP